MISIHALLKRATLIKMTDLIQLLFQFTLSWRERHTLNSWHTAKKKFQFTLSWRERQEMTDERMKLREFQFTLSWRERHGHLLILGAEDFLFQFTLSWRERLYDSQSNYFCLWISIHALLKRATSIVWWESGCKRYFNSRSPEESDYEIYTTWV